MQAQTLPISINTANATPAPARGPAADAGTDASTPFAEALSREIDQRRPSTAPAEAAPAQDARPAPGAKSAAQSREAAADAAQAAIAADAAAVDPVTDMLALAASIVQPAAAPVSAEVPADTATAATIAVIPANAGTHAESAITPPASASTPAPQLTAPIAASIEAPSAGKMGSDPISTAAPVTMAAGKMGTDPISGKMGTDPISRKMGTDPISEASMASPASAMFAQALGTAQTQVEGAAQLRSMFATASAQVAQAPGAVLSSDASPLASDPLLGVVVQPQARAAVQAAQAAPAQASELQQDLASLASAGGESAPEPVASETPHDASFATQLQAARAETAPANQLVAGERLPARVGTPAWDKQLGQKIVFMAAGAEQSASLILNPPDLGPVQVVLNITNDQASVAFSSSQLEVRQALENAMPKLREMMGESGITLGNATVNAGMPEQQQQAQRGQDARAGGQHGNGRGNGGGAGGDDAAPAAPVRRAAIGAVDTFA